MSIKERCRNRLDLTDYLTHFIHKPTLPYKQGVLCYDDCDNPIYPNPRKEYVSNYVMKNNESFEVLKKILYDGIINTGWSERNQNATIYGKRSAVCFTEMPLYALINYAMERQELNKVDQYGISFKRRLLYWYGARPVIYGFSNSNLGNVSEYQTNAGYRLLDEKIHLPLCEQYRFVRTDIYCSDDPSNDFDWMHEREWRWPIKVNEDDGTPVHPDVPGLPIYGFKDVVITVRTLNEKAEIVQLLQTFYNDPDWTFAMSKEKLATWKVVSAEDLWSNSLVPQLLPYRIEDLIQRKLSVSIIP